MNGIAYPAYRHLEVSADRIEWIDLLHVTPAEPIDRARAVMLGAADATTNAPGLIQLDNFQLVNEQCPAH